MKNIFLSKHINSIIINQCRSFLHFKSLPSKRGINLGRHRYTYTYMCLSLHERQGCERRIAAATKRAVKSKRNITKANAKMGIENNNIGSKHIYVPSHPQKNRLLLLILYILRAVIPLFFLRFWCYYLLLYFFLFFSQKRTFFAFEHYLCEKCEFLWNLNSTAIVCVCKI